MQQQLPVERENTPGTVAQQSIYKTSFIDFLIGGRVAHLLNLRKIKINRIYI
jgi:hypothetical protein